MTHAKKTSAPPVAPAVGRLHRPPTIRRTPIMTGAPESTRQRRPKRSMVHRAIIAPIIAITLILSSLLAIIGYTAYPRTMAAVNASKTPPSWKKYVLYSAIRFDPNHLIQTRQNAGTQTRRWVVSACQAVQLVSNSRRCSFERRLTICEIPLDDPN